jgi:DNA-binding transcriptional regulator YiaG
MRYKNNVLEKLGQIDAIANRLNVQVNRGGSQEQVNESIEMLKEAIEQTREMVSIEHDEFAQQFNQQ